MFINYRCEFLRSKKSSEEVTDYIQSYKGFVGVTVIYSSIFSPQVSFWLPNNTWIRRGWAFFFLSWAVLLSYSFFPSPTSHLAEWRKSHSLAELEPLQFLFPGLAFDWSVCLPDSLPLFEASSPSFPWLPHLNIGNLAPSSIVRASELLPPSCLLY